ncbi:tRNA (uracil-5-)-methyltransferase homolog B-like [Macrosteles quadrilineatus]|uniref:tRNA (uracil-5-)-methyltransferase homolog B-like n=1 Tax=Macrosteles quadrilineatus TaxID=74068 RepID=UPI0023E11819|nr:tRNA (uracil-5-)-methyltransferase homolog B-like [Macrosteles quadrilineatus]
MSIFLKKKSFLLENCLESTGNVIYGLTRHFAQQVVHPFKITSKANIERHKAFVNRVNIENQHEVLADMITPCWKMSYEEELDYKQKMCAETLEYLFYKLSRRKEDVQGVMKRIVPSPSRDCYRNKNEFNIWMGVDGNPKTVGYFIGIPAAGKVVSVPANNLKCIKESHTELAKIYQDLVSSSPLAASYQLFDGGFWRSLIVRSNDKGDHQAFIITHPSTLTPDQITEQQEIMAEHFKRHSPETSLFHQSCPHVKCPREVAKIHNLRGEPFMYETLAGLQFRISPDSFFQINKPAAEIMYDIALGMAKPKHFTTLLDLYCGTGGISLLASGHVRGSVGVEQVTAAVEDAKHNANINNITNCTFVAGKVEMKLAKILSELEYSSDIVAIVNPGRAGASEGVISMLRKNQQIRRVVYISCRPDNPLTMKNFVQLCEVMGSTSRPYILKTAVPVDLFPYTNSYELVLCFDKT